MKTILVIFALFPSIALGDSLALEYSPAISHYRPAITPAADRSSGSIVGASYTISSVVPGADLRLGASLYSWQDATANLSPILSAGLGREIDLGGSWSFVFSMGPAFAPGGFIRPLGLFAEMGAAVYFDAIGFRVNYLAGDGHLIAAGISIRWK